MIASILLGVCFALLFGVAIVYKKAFDTDNQKLMTQSNRLGFLAMSLGFLSAGIYMFDLWAQSPSPPIKGVEVHLPAQDVPSPPMNATHPPSKKS